MAHVVAKSCASFGASIAIMSLATGAIWGKPTWGAWWVWDARLTAMLVLFFLYVGVIALHSAFENTQSADKASAILSLISCTQPAFFSRCSTSMRARCIKI
jgi:heme exporter protein C